jgi:hypothetical protein
MIDGQSSNNTSGTTLCTIMDEYGINSALNNTQACETIYQGVLLKGIL